LQFGVFVVAGWTKGTPFSHKLRRLLTDPLLGFR
jgi:hypothetical protein